MSLKKLTALAGLLLLQNVNAANFEYCPSVDDIKNHNFHGWLPLYIENEELAMDNDVNTFAEGLTKFDTARFDTKYLEFAHCFYQGTDPMVSKIIFAKDAWKPMPSRYWRWSTEDRQAYCISGITVECGFIT
jgi:hypothetical protein